MYVIARRRNLLSLLAVILTLLQCIWAQEEHGAIWMPSPHKTSGRGGTVPKWLIIHGTAGGESAEAIGRWFQNPGSKASAHYTVGQDGMIVQSVSESDTAWGNGRIETGADDWWSNHPSPNQATISVEHVKSKTDNSDELTEAQRNASWNLISNILARNKRIRPGWADASGGITGHFSISPSSRMNCPGPVPWADLFKHLTGTVEYVCLGSVSKKSINIVNKPQLNGSNLGSLPQHRVVRLGNRINKDWFELGSPKEGFVRAEDIKIHTKQPTWCTRPQQHCYACGFHTGAPMYRDYGCQLTPVPSKYLRRLKGETIHIEPDQIPLVRVGTPFQNSQNYPYVYCRMTAQVKAGVAGTLFVRDCLVSNAPWINGCSSFETGNFTGNYCISTNSEEMLTSNTSVFRPNLFPTFTFIVSYSYVVFYSY